MRVLLTGSAGFIGGAVDQTLTDAGVEVVRADLMLPAAHGEVAAPEGTHQLDVRDADSPGQWEALLAGVDVVCHQAAVVGAGVQVSDLPSYASHNDLGTAALLSAMHAAGVHRLVLASSMVVYGEGRYTCPEHGLRPPGARPVAALEAGEFDHHCGLCGQVLGWETVDEDAPLSPRSSYAASKVAQEHYAHSWARQAGGSVVALRYHNVYGPRMPRDTPYSGVAALFRSALERGEAPTVFEDGAQARDFVHVDDVARANALALEAVTGVGAGEMSAYNVCSGRPVTILEVARALAGAYQDVPAPQVTGGFRAGDVRHVVASPERARSALGFTARIGPEQGLAGFATAPLRG